MVLPYINMNPPQVYTCSPSWIPFPPPSPSHPSGLSQCTSPKHPVSSIKPGLAIRLTYDIIYVSMPFSQIIPPSPSPTESIRLFYISVSLLLSRIQGYRYHLSKFHVYVLVYSSTLAWKIPWTEEPGGLQSMGSRRVRHDWMHTHTQVLEIEICWIFLVINCKYTKSLPCLFFSSQNESGLLFSWIWK